MGWTSMQEWSKASTVAGALVLSASIAWAAFGPKEAPPAPAWGLSQADRATIVAAATQQLVTLNTMDPAHVFEGLDAWERVTTAGERDRLREARSVTHARFLRERVTLSAARVTTVLPMSSGSGRYGPDDTDRTDDNGWAYLKAVVRLTSTKPGGRPVELLRRYDVNMVLTPHGWRVSGLSDTPGGLDFLVTYSTTDGPPSRESLMIKDVREMLTDLARGKGRDALTGAAAGDFDRIWRRAAAHPGHFKAEEAEAVGTAIIRQDAGSAQLLSYVNLGLMEPVKEGGMSGFSPSEGGKLALKVTVVPDGPHWKITRLQDA
ncbi:hypothetical protein OHR68_02915 [Spirillospora sp. NBC_00431]